MTKYLIILIMTLGTKVSAQLPTFDNPYVPEISKKVKLIDESIESKFETLSFSIDSISITFKNWPNKIETNNYLTQNDTPIKIEFYTYNDSLIFIKIEEESTKYRLVIQYTEIYFHEGKEVLFWDYTQRPIGLSYAPEIDPDEWYGFNPKITETFLRTYSLKLYNLITEKLSTP